MESIKSASDTQFQLTNQRTHQKHSVHVATLTGLSQSSPFYTMHELVWLSATFPVYMVVFKFEFVTGIAPER